ncbi:MAG: hypothetical protein R2831_05850 [Chitinophagaceae bacterium]
MRIFILTLLCLPFILFAQAKKKKKNKTQQTSTQASTPNFSAAYEKPFAAPGSPILNFSVVTSDEKIFESKDFKANNPFAIILFNPSCGHCMDVAKNLRTQINNYPDFTFLFITGMNLLDKTKSFAQEAGIDTIANIIVSADHSNVTEKLFEYKGIPQFMIYNNEHFLSKTFYINIPVDSIRQYIH